MFTKYRLIKVILLLFTFIMYLPSLAHANQCRNVGFMKQHIKGSSYVIEPLMHNGKVLDKQFSIGNILRSDIGLPMEQGWHSMLLRVWEVRTLKSYSKLGFTNNRKLVEPVDIFGQFKVSNNNISIGIKSIDNKLETITKASSNHRPCIRNHTILASLNREEIDVGDILPKSLNFQLQRVVAKIKQQNNQRDIYKPLSLNEETGFAFELSKQNAIRVLAVAPFSFADKLGLHSGDEIIVINGVAISQFHQKEDIQEYLSSIQYGEKIELVVERDNAQQILRSRFEPSMVPEFRLSFSGVEQAENLTFPSTLTTDTKTKIELDNVLQSIELYLREKKPEVKRITIKQKEQYDVFGLLLSSTSEGIKVVSVLDGSPAEHIGLQEQDIIVSFNSREFRNGQINSIKAMIENLQANQKIEFKVIRNDAVKMVIGVYEPKILPAFAISIQLKSASYLKELIAATTAKRENKPCFMCEDSVLHRNITNRLDYVQNAKLLYDIQHGIIPLPKDDPTYNKNSSN